MNIEEVKRLFGCDDEKAQKIMDLNLNLNGAKDFYVNKSVNELNNISKKLEIEIEKINKEIL